MRSLHLSVLAAVTALASAPAFAQGVVINEFSYDDSGTDDREFVELYNATGAPVDISGWVLESQDPSGPNAAYTIPPGTTLNANDYYVLGAGTVPNVDLVVGATNLWENSNETLELRDGPGGNLIDAAAYECYLGPATASGTWPADIAAQIGEGIWGTFTSIDSRETSWSRYRDGYDTDNNGRDFRMVPHTPGTSNDLSSVLAYVENFDALTVGQDVPGWGNSWLEAQVIDPTTITDPQGRPTRNPSPIAASPSGGNAMITWDTAGGGNASMLLTDAVENVVFEAYVYFDAMPELSGEYETWGIGVQGSVETYFNSPDFGAAATAGFTANGCTGVALMYQCTDTGGMLYLVDLGDGGWGSLAQTPATVLDSLAITQGVNDGWQRVRLQAGADYAEAFFGGTFGQFDGTRLGGRTSGGAPGGVYIGYREFVGQNGSTRPPTLDFLFVRDGITDVEYFGEATPNSAGTPELTPNSMPNLGNAGFALGFSGLRANDFVAALLGFSVPASPLNLEPLGAQPGSRVYINIATGVTLQANANGETSLALAIPTTPSLSGGVLYAQGVEVDANLAFGLPVAQTQAVALTLGN